MNIDEYEKIKAAIKLIAELSAGEKSASEKGWINIEEAENLLGI